MSSSLGSTRLFRRSALPLTPCPPRRVLRPAREGNTRMRIYGERLSTKKSPCCQQSIRVKKGARVKKDSFSVLKNKTRKAPTFGRIGRRWSKTQNYPREFSCTFVLHEISERLNRGEAGCLSTQSKKVNTSGARPPIGQANVPMTRAILYRPAFQIQIEKVAQASLEGRGPV